MDPSCPALHAAEQVAARAVRSTFAPLVGSISLLGARSAAPGAPAGAVHALPDEIRGISETARALVDHGEAATRVAVRLCDSHGAVVGAVDITWRLSRAPKP